MSWRFEITPLNAVFVLYTLYLQVAKRFPEAGSNSISESQFEDAVREKPFKPFKGMLV